MLLLPMLLSTLLLLTQGLPTEDMTSVGHNRTEELGGCECWNMRPCCRGSAWVPGTWDVCACCLEIIIDANTRQYCGEMCNPTLPCTSQAGHSLSLVSDPF